MTRSTPAAQPTRILGFCWFRRDDYADARGMMADPEVLFETFDEWLAAAKKIEREVTARGDKVVRIRFDAPAFLLWCVGKNRLPNEQSRAAWAADEAKKKFAGRA